MKKYISGSIQKNQLAAFAIRWSAIVIKAIQAHIFIQYSLSTLKSCQNLVKFHALNHSSTRIDSNKWFFHANICIPLSWIVFAILWIAKGPSINDVTPIFQFFDPPPSPLSPQFCLENHPKLPIFVPPLPHPLGWRHLWMVPNCNALLIDTRY